VDPKCLTIDMAAGGSTAKSERAQSVGIPVIIIAAIVTGMVLVVLCVIITFFIGCIKRTHIETF